MYINSPESLYSLYSLYTYLSCSLTSIIDCVVFVKGSNNTVLTIALHTDTLTKESQCYVHLRSSYRIPEFCSDTEFVRNPSVLSGYGVRKESQCSVRIRSSYRIPVFCPDTEFVRNPSVLSGYGVRKESQCSVQILNS